MLGSPDASHAWHSDALYPEAAVAVERTRKAMRDGEKIAIFGDYDADGVTSTALLLRFFRRHGTEPSVRLPHRIHDGYGLRMKHIEAFAEDGITLLFTVDTGVSSRAEIERAAEHGMDVIVLDHHHFSQRPPALAVMHPALARVPVAHPPSAAGVVFAFLHALESEAWAGREEDLALATIGTIADVVALRDGNRALVTEGLAAMRRLPPSPLQALLEGIGKGNPLTSTDIAFRVAPRINAAGRMADPALALSALLEGGEDMRMLEHLNAERQTETTRSIDRALASLDPTGRFDPHALPPFVATASEDYTHGIIGLISGRLTERFGRPSMAVAIDGDTCVASLRSSPFYNIAEGLGRVSHLLVTYGGHAQAAGCTFKKEAFGELTRALNEDVAARVQPDDLIPTLTIDATIPLHAIGLPFCASLAQLEPYGQANAEPLFLSRNVLLGAPRTVGAEGKHLQAYAGHCKLIGFNMGHLLPAIHKPTDLVYRLGIDTWNNKATPQLMLVDMRAAA